LLVFPFYCKVFVIFIDMTSVSKKLLINGYDELKNTVKTFEKDKRIFVLFYGSQNSQGCNW